MGLQTTRLRPKRHTQPPLLPRQRRASPDSLPADVACSPARCSVSDGQRGGRASRTASTHWSISALDDERVPTPATRFGSSPVHALSKEFGCECGQGARARRGAAYSAARRELVLIAEKVVALMKRGLDGVVRIPRNPTRVSVR